MLICHVKPVHVFCVPGMMERWNDRIVGNKTLEIIFDLFLSFKLIIPTFQFSRRSHRLLWRPSSAVALLRRMESRLFQYSKFERSGQ